MTSSATRADGIGNDKVIVTGENSGNVDEGAESSVTPASGLSTESPPFRPRAVSASGSTGSTGMSSSIENTTTGTTAQPSTLGKFSLTSSSSANIGNPILDNKNIPRHPHPTQQNPRSHLYPNHVHQIGEKSYGNSGNGNNDISNGVSGGNRHYQVKSSSGGVRGGATSPLSVGGSSSSTAGLGGASSAAVSSTATPPLPAEVHSNAIAKHTFRYGSGTLEIRNVWAENVQEEMANIRSLVETHPFVAMDTEFPGIVARPISETYSHDYHYKSLKVNVDLLKIIQLGLSFADADGNFAKGCPCWQFNFRFSLSDDMFAQDSIDLLVKSGISFDDHASRGIDPLLFGELLMMSGLVLDDRVKWVSFHSGYDYGYLLKLLTYRQLPKEEKTFFDSLHLYFPTIYDIKYMMSLCDGHYGGLQKLADDLQCQRVGSEHQAGSDSLLTMSTYFALAKSKFSKGIEHSTSMSSTYSVGGVDVNEHSGTSDMNCNKKGSSNIDENRKSTKMNIRGGGDDNDGKSNISNSNDARSLIGGVSRDNCEEKDGSIINTSGAGTVVRGVNISEDIITDRGGNGINDSKYFNELYGYGSNHTARRGAGGHHNNNSNGVDITKHFPLLLPPPGVRGGAAAIAAAAAAEAAQAALNGADSRPTTPAK